MKVNDEPIIVEQILNATVETVWKSITEIDLMRNWYFETIPSFRAEVGFETRFTVESGERVFPHVWKVTEVEPMKKIAYDWRYEGYTGDSFVVFELFEEDNATRVKLTHTVRESFPDNIPDFSRESGIAGWEFFIKKSLTEFLEDTQSK